MINTTGKDHDQDQDQGLCHLFQKEKGNVPGVEKKRDTVIVIEIEIVIVIVTEIVIAEVVPEIKTDGTEVIEKTDLNEVEIEIKNGVTARRDLRVLQKTGPIGLGQGIRTMINMKMRNTYLLITQNLIKKKNKNGWNLKCRKEGRESKGGGQRERKKS